MMAAKPIITGATTTALMTPYMAALTCVSHGLGTGSAGASRMSTLMEARRSLGVSSGAMSGEPGEPEGPAGGGSMLSKEEDRVKPEVTRIHGRMAGGGRRGASGPR